ncbi:LANO_0E11100g1_1 [Lachancea nothofagi CBS 11611]|uniref:LANO_0E11100g1_1 n=1 Tax=Lachancea nothofagi CBS 11611 TaxID=1266666 RepID=A0A1G4JXF3_9SACH|nr:LANO_0E11100g1_1 [Lachancea nothofagi CBS 11611]
MPSVGGSPSHYRADSELSDGFSAPMDPARIQIFKSTPTKGSSLDPKSTPSPTMPTKVHSEANRLMRLLKSKTVKSEPLPNDFGASVDLSPANKASNELVMKTLSQEQHPDTSSGKSFHGKVSQWISHTLSASNSPIPMRNLVKTSEVHSSSSQSLTKATLMPSSKIEQGAEPALATEPAPVAEPALVAEPTQPALATEPTETALATKPALATESMEPALATKSVLATEPVEPTLATKAALETKAALATRPGRSEESAQATEPVQATKRVPVPIPVQEAALVPGQGSVPEPGQSANPARAAALPSEKPTQSVEAVQASVFGTPTTGAQNQSSQYSTSLRTGSALARPLTQEGSPPMSRTEVASSSGDATSVSQSFSPSYLPRESPNGQRYRSVVSSNPLKHVPSSSAQSNDTASAEGPTSSQKILAQSHELGDQALLRLKASNYDASRDKNKSTLHQTPFESPELSSHNDKQAIKDSQRITSKRKEPDSVMPKAVKEAVYTEDARRKKLSTWPEARSAKLDPQTPDKDSISTNTEYRFPLGLKNSSSLRPTHAELSSSVICAKDSQLKSTPSQTSNPIQGGTNDGRTSHPIPGLVVQSMPLRQSALFQSSSPRTDGERATLKSVQKKKKASQSISHKIISSTQIAVSISKAPQLRNGGQVSTEKDDATGIEGQFADKNIGDASSKSQAKPAPKIAAIAVETGKVDYGRSQDNSSKPSGKRPSENALEDNITPKRPTQVPVGSTNNIDKPTIPIAKSSDQKIIHSETLVSPPSQSTFAKTSDHDPRPEASSNAPSTTSSSSSKGKRGGTKTQKVTGGLRVKLRSLGDQNPMSIGFTENMLILPEVVIGCGDTMKAGSKRIKRPSVEDPNKESNVEGAPLLRTGSDHEIDDLSAGISDASSDSFDVDKELFSRNKEISGKVRGDTKTVKGIDTASSNGDGKLMNHPAKDQAASANSSSKNASSLSVPDDASPTEEKSAQSSTKLHPDPETDRKKYERIVARYLNNKISKYNRLDEYLLKGLIQAGIVKHKPLKEGPLVTSSNDICNINNYETSPVLYLQHISKRSRIEPVQLSKLQLPIMRSQEGHLDCETRKELMRKLKVSKFLIDMRGLENLAAQEKALVRERVAHLKSSFSKLQIELCDTMSSEINVIVTLGLSSEDDSQKFEASETLEAFGTQIWSYAYAIKFFELLLYEETLFIQDEDESGRATPTLPLGQQDSAFVAGGNESSIAGPQESNNGNHVIPSKVLDISLLEHSLKADKAKGDQAARRLKKLVEKLYRELKGERLEDAILEITKCAETLFEERALDKMNVEISNMKDRELHLLTKEVMENQVKFSSLHGQISCKSKEIEQLNQELQEERLKGENWRFVFRSLIDKTEDELFTANPDRQITTELPSEAKHGLKLVKKGLPLLTADQVLDKKIVENIHLIKDALHKRRDMPAGSNSLQSSAPFAKPKATITHASIDLSKNTETPGNTEIGKGSTEVSYKESSSQNYALLKEELRKSSEKLEENFAAQEELKRLVATLEANRKFLDQSLMSKTLLLREEQVQHRKHFAQYVAVVEDQRQIIMKMENDLKIEVSKRESLSSRVRALVSNLASEDVR